MIFVLVAAVWSRRPRWHRTPTFASGTPTARPPVRMFPKPGEDPLLFALADAGGDLTAHRTVHTPKEK